MTAKTPIPEIESNRFHYDNSIRWLRLAPPAWLDTASGKIHIDKPWILLGWSRKLRESLTLNREGQLALLFFHPEYGEAWEHYPWYPEDGELTTDEFQGEILLVS